MRKDPATQPGRLTENADGQKAWHFCVYNGAYVFNFGVPSFARMAELADARDSKSRALKRRVGSTPTPGIMSSRENYEGGKAGKGSKGFRKVHFRGHGVGHEGRQEKSEPF